MKAYLTFFSDDAHGWLQVPKGLFKAMNGKASQYSYLNDKEQLVYLEEDCDAPAFIELMKAKACDFEILEITIPGESMIRRLPRMVG